MVGTVVIFGAGDMARRMAAGLLAQGRPERLILTDVAPERMREEVAMLGICHEASVELQQLDGCDEGAVARLLRATRPDLVVQAASLIGPWAIIGRDHPVIGHLSKAGIGIQLPNQLAVLTSVMRAARDIGLGCPVANISAPDLTHPVLARLGLEPTVGLGNVSVALVRARAALRARRRAAGEPAGPLPLLRLIGHHAMVYGVMQARPPADPVPCVRVHVGEEGGRDDALAYEGPVFPPSPLYNLITGVSAIPVLSALLPDGRPLRTSAPAPFGLPGGYPLIVAPEGVALDLPPSVTRDEAVAVNTRMAREDGIKAIDADGTVHFTERARDHAARVDPRLAEPLDPRDVDARARLLVDIVSAAT